MRTISVYLAAMICFIGTKAVADIAPTTFAGGTLVPLEISDLQFADAQVKITWGNPCKLDASFEIANDRKAPVELEIGFPVGGYDPNYRDEQSSEQTSTLKVGTEMVPASIIEIGINGVSMPAYRRINIPAQCAIQFGHASWYFTKAKLEPGKNIITVRTFLKPSGVYCRPYQRQIEYCIWTGGRWNGRIKHERIEIAFPDTVSNTLIQEVKPELFETKGNRLIWDYKNIEPKNNFFDIKLVVQIPEIDACVGRLEHAFIEAPTNSKVALRFARHLFQLGYMKGNSGFPPRSLPATDYYRLIDCLKGESLACFKRHYSIFREEVVMGESSEWTPDRVKMVQILGEAGYCENYGGIANVLRAKGIVRDALAREPHNEDAWLLLLDNYWRFSFAARGHWFGPTTLSTAQIKDIHEAAKNCPESQPIQAWLALVNAPTSQAESRGPVGPKRNYAEESEFPEIMKKYGNGFEDD